MSCFLNINIGCKANRTLHYNPVIHLDWASLLIKIVLESDPVAGIKNNYRVNNYKSQASVWLCVCSCRSYSSHFLISKAVKNNCGEVKSTISSISWSSRRRKCHAKPNFELQAHNVWKWARYRTTTSSPWLLHRFVSVRVNGLCFSRWFCLFVSCSWTLPSFALWIFSLLPWVCLPALNCLFLFLPSPASTPCKPFCRSFEFVCMKSWSCIKLNPRRLHLGPPPVFLVSLLAQRWQTNWPVKDSADGLFEEELYDLSCILCSSVVVGRGPLTGWGVCYLKGPRIPQNPGFPAC